MSAKNRGTVTKKNDFYPTPEPVVQAILDNIDWAKVNSFCEPCRGDGAIYDLIPLNGSQMSWYELEHDRDYLAAFNPSKVDLTLTNPPFTFAREFIEKALTHSGTVIMLTRINFLGSKSRLNFWKKIGLKQINVITPRPSFYGKCVKKESPECKKLLFPLEYSKPCPACNGPVRDSTDATEYTWLVFGDTSILKDDSPFRWIKLK